jgi:hypothetical protein
MKIDGAENDVFSGGSDTADSKLAPPAEDPDAKALRTAEVPPPPIAEKSAPAAVVSPPPVADNSAAAAALPALPQAASQPSTGAQPSLAARAPEGAKPVAAPTGKPAVVASASSARPAAVPAKPQTAAVEAHSPASGHPAMVQLGALPSEEAARKEWQQLAKRMPGLINGRQPSFTRIERDGHTFWRLRTAGFADVAQAKGFCDLVRAKGGGCTVADF